MAITINVIDSRAGDLKPSGAPGPNNPIVLEEDAKFIIDKQYFEIDTTGVADANEVIAWGNVLTAVQTAVDTDLNTYIDNTATIKVDVYVLPFKTKRATAGGMEPLQPQTGDFYNIPVSIWLEVD